MSTLMRNATRVAVTWRFDKPKWLWLFGGCDSSSTRSVSFSCRFYLRNGDTGKKCSYNCQHHTHQPFICSASCTQDLTQDLTQILPAARSNVVHGAFRHAYHSYVTPNTRARVLPVALAAYDHRPSLVNSQRKTLPPDCAVDDVDVLTGAAGVTREIMEEKNTLEHLKVRVYTKYEHYIVSNGLPQAWRVSHQDFEKLQSLLSEVGRGQCACAPPGTFSHRQLRM